MTMMNYSSANSYSQADKKISYWLDTLEKEFDKAYVDLDMVLGEIDADQAELIYEGRQKMTALSSAFAQLVHKSQAIFSCNARLQSEVAAFRNEVCMAHSSLIAQRKESERLMIHIHALQCQILSKTAPHESDMIKKKLDHDSECIRREMLPVAKLQAEAEFLRKENSYLRKCVMGLQNEVYGARLAARYLDRELAGRIQQIQLLGREIKGPQHERLWNQLEAEIHLHRHKTVVRACRGRFSKNLPKPRQSEEKPGGKTKSFATRTIVISKTEKEGLGISITGGREHGVPILVSEIHKVQTDNRGGQLYVGDAILKCNGVDLRKATHNFAVETLAKQEGKVELEVVFIPADEDSDDECSMVIELPDGSWLDTYRNALPNDLFPNEKSDRLITN